MAIAMTMPPSRLWSHRQRGLWRRTHGLVYHARPVDSRDAARMSALTSAWFRVPPVIAADGLLESRHSPRWGGPRRAGLV